MTKTSSTRLRVALGLAVAAGAVVVVTMRSSGVPAPLTVGASAPVVASPSPALSATAPDPDDLARTHAVPGYLPAGAEPAGGKAVLHGGWIQHFTLPGAANSRELPATPTKPTPGVPMHPATGIDLSQWPQDVSTFQGVDPRLATVVTISLPGATATVVTPISGYGVYRVSWVRGGVAYDLQTQHLKAGGDEGTSGIPLTELVKMAESIA